MFSFSNNYAKQSSVISCFLLVKINLIKICCSLGGLILFNYTAGLNCITYAGEIELLQPTCYISISLKVMN